MRRASSYSNVKQPIFLSSFRDAPKGADPESIAPYDALIDGFSGAQLRTIARAHARPGMTARVETRPFPPRDGFPPG
jgi:hypothetical protein